MSETSTSAKQWFVVHTYSGFENKVASAIESRAKIFNLQDLFGRVIEGPFVNFQGSIDDLNPERGKLKVMVAIFGRMTPVELEYYQVERL